MENKKMEISEFYKKVFSDFKLKEKLEEKVKKITNEEDFKKLIREEIMPLMKRFKLNFSEEDLLNYEKETLKEISNEILENVSGGASIKSALLAGGVLSMALIGGVGVATTASAMIDPPRQEQGQVETGDNSQQQNNNDDNAIKFNSQNARYIRFRRFINNAGNQLHGLLEYLRKNNVKTKEDSLNFLKILERQDSESFRNLSLDTAHLASQIKPIGKEQILIGKWFPDTRFSQEEFQLIGNLEQSFKKLENGPGDALYESKNSKASYDVEENHNENNINESVNNGIDDNNDKISKHEINPKNTSDIEPITLPTKEEDNNTDKRTTAECLRKSQQNWKNRQMSGTWQAFEEKKFVGVLTGNFSLLDVGNLKDNGLYNGDKSYYNEFFVETPFGQSGIRIRYLLNGNELVETSRLIIAKSGQYTSYEEISTDFNNLSQEIQKIVAENILKYFNIAVIKHDKRNADFVLKNKEISPLEKFNGKVENLRTSLARGGKKIDNQVLSDFCAILMFGETAEFRNPTGGKLERAFINKLIDILENGAPKDVLKGDDFSLIDILHAFYLPSFNHKDNPPGGKEATNTYISNDGILPREEYVGLWAPQLKETVKNMDNLPVSDDSSEGDSTELPRTKTAQIPINLKNVSHAYISIPVYETAKAEMLANKYAYLTANEKDSDKLTPEKIQFI